MAQEISAPTGRLVWGDPHKMSPVMDDTTKQQKRHPQTGEPLVECSFGVAYDKNDPEWHSYYWVLKGADKAEWPQFHDAQGNVLPGAVFADKITDGDGYNKKGQLRAREGNGYAGCFVVKYASQFPVNCFTFDHQQNRWVVAPDGMIKPGDYIRVSGSTQSNKSTQSPGMYRNPNMVALVGKGTPIVASGGDPDAAFGKTPPPLPPGATIVPQAPVAPMPPAGGPGVPPVPGAPPPAPSAGPPANGGPPAPPTAAGGSGPVPPMTASPSNPPPYNGYVPGAPPSPPTAAPGGAPPPPPPGAPAAPQRHMTAAATTTYDEYIKAGWTDTQLIASGLMTDHVPV